MTIFSWHVNFLILTSCIVVLDSQVALLQLNIVPSSILSTENIQYNHYPYSHPQNQGKLTNTLKLWCIYVRALLVA